MFDVLRDVVQPSKQIQWIPQCRQGAGPEAGRNPKPGLLAQLNHDPIFQLVDAERDRGLPPGGRAGPAPDLYDQFSPLTEHLGAQISLIEFSQQGLGDIRRIDVPVKNFTVHEVDYNRLCDSP